MFRKFALVLAILLAGCAKEPIAIETAAQATKDSLLALEVSLDDKCASAAIKTQINAIKKQVEGLEAACETEKAYAVAVERDKARRWQLAFLGLLLLYSGLALLKYLFKTRPVV